MFENFDDELQTIKTRKFHIVDGPADQTLRTAVEETAAEVPHSYKAFVMRYGNAKLYRELDYYLIGVLAPPSRETSFDGEVMYRFGHYDTSDQFFRAGLLCQGAESPAFEQRNGKWIKVADGFEEWFARRTKAARKRYSKEEWKRVTAGPRPFTPEEQRIVEARRRYTCRLVSLTPDGKLGIEIHNASSATLPFISVGLNWQDGRLLSGGLWLPVSHIQPGETAIVECEAYKGMTDMTAVKIFVQPDPQAEDRDRYWEFRAPTNSRM